jgi:hypothetical protein
MARNGTGTASLDTSSVSPLENPKSEEDFEKALREQSQSMAAADREQTIAMQSAPMQTLPEATSTAANLEYVGAEREVGFDPAAPVFKSMQEALAVKPATMTMVSAKDPVSGEVKMMPMMVEDPRYGYAQNWIAAEMRLRQIRPEPEKPLKTWQIDGHPTLVQARSDIEALARHNDLTGRTHLSPAGRKVREVRAQNEHLKTLTREQIMQEMSGSAFLG